MNRVKRNEGCRPAQQLSPLNALNYMSCMCCFDAKQLAKALLAGSRLLRSAEFRKLLLLIINSSHGREHDIELCAQQQPASATKISSQRQDISLNDLCCSTTAALATIRVSAQQWQCNHAMAALYSNYCCSLFINTTITLLSTQLIMLDTIVGTSTAIAMKQ